MTGIVEKCANILVMKNKRNNTANKLEKPNIVNERSLVKPVGYICHHEETDGISLTDKNCLRLCL